MDATEAATTADRDRSGANRREEDEGTGGGPRMIGLLTLNRTKLFQNLNYQVESFGYRETSEGRSRVHHTGEADAVV